ncbi:MAG: protoheme IX farnesyltransferase [Alphaproteobacteria bacterium]|jgi:protoheme IX farnesyltransferase|nr:protoheme IX farnesyltransferase [Alphaproteobacteria bacterium]
MALTSNQNANATTDGLYGPSVADFWQLLKPRVMSLVIFTGFVGMFLAPADMHPLLFVISLFAIAAGAGASGAINQWYDRDIDAVMERTRGRPVPSGAVEPAEALSFGLVISTLSVLLLGLASNWLAAGLLAFTIFFYGVVYTIWLKRSTPQNIVIGGAAGALPPVIGWAAVTGGLSVEPLILFAVIFMWTPPHFWALALFRNDDYLRANVPMMPVVAGETETRRQILIYAVLLAPLALAPAVIGMTSMAYGVVVAALGLNFIRLSWVLYRQPDDAAAKRLFAFSILYLFLLFLGLVIDRLLVTSGVLAVL